MPRNFLKRYIPSPDSLRKEPGLRWLGRMLEDTNLFHLNRQSVSLAFLIGLFCAFVPLPAQMILAALLAYACRANLPVSVSLVWLTNPLTMAPIFYFCYKLGSWMLGLEPIPLDVEPGWQWLSAKLGQLWQPLLLGSLSCGIVAGGLGYLLVYRLWRWQVITRWEERKKARLAAK